ncbi:hypothetical protein SDC9_108208 [bioreactor metagenome]|uniref:Uncharacterized protein n=1 Tax=bioreactor metagenome TaxID=1076179 RepID=A0A645B7C6_9ZZZZ
MTGEGQKINTHAFHVDWINPGGLRRVHREPDALFPAERANLAHGQDCAADIGGMGTEYRLRVALKAGPDRLRVQRSIRRTLGHADLHACLSQRVQRAHHCVVLYGGDDHVVAGRECSLQKLIQRGGDSAGKADAGVFWRGK